MIYLQLFLSFLKVGAFSFGGGYAALPLIQGEVIHKYHWLSTGQFMDLITISQMTPGPIAVNSATFVGMQLAGLPGALAATAGCIFPSCILVTFLAWLYLRYKNGNLMNGVLQTLRPAVVALIAAAGVDIFVSAVFVATQGNMDFTLSGSALSLDALQKTASSILKTVNIVQLLFFVIAFLLIRKTKWNPVLIMVGCGVCAALLECVKFFI